MIPFINRDYDINELCLHIKGDPNSILFVYSPKSSGKSTVIRRVIKEMENSDVVFFYYNLRKYATPTKEEFLEIKNSMKKDSFEFYKIKSFEEKVRKNNVDDKDLLNKLKDLGKNKKKKSFRSNENLKV